MHCRKNNRVSLFRIVSGDLHVWQVTYSLMYRLNTFSICFCWNLPFMMSWLLPSMAPLVPNSAKRKASKCLGCLWSILAISEKLAKAVFLLPTLTTWAENLVASKNKEKWVKISHLWRPHDKLLLLAGNHVGVLVPHNSKHSLKANESVLNSTFWKCKADEVFTWSSSS